MTTTFPDAVAAATIIGGFLSRLPALDPLVRALVGDEPMVLVLELRDPPLRVAIDLGAHPLRVTFGSTASGTVALSATADDFHAVLLGTLPIGAGITQKRLVTRGSTARMMRVMPVFFVAPVLYAEHLEAIGREDLLAAAKAPPASALTPEEPMNAVVNRLAWAAGFALGMLKRRVAKDLDILAAVEAMGRGLQRARPAPDPAEPPR